MVICKFFQEGRCKYGINCRFEHSSYDHRKENYRQDGNQGFHQHQRYLQPQRDFHHATQPQNYFPQQNVYNPVQYQHQSRFGTSQSQPAHPEQNQAYKDSIKVVLEDAILWEKGNQWLFSCYAPLLRKLLPNSANSNSENLPGFTDYSPEELRLEALHSHQAGQFNQYVSNLHQLAQRHITNRGTLQNPDPQTAEFILRYEAGESVTPPGSAFNTSVETSMPVINQAPSAASSFSFTLPAERDQPPAKPFTFSLGNVPNKANESSVAGGTFFPAPLHPVASTGISPSPVALPSNIDVYSVLAELSSLDLELYKTDKFSLGKIPRCPPPQEMCF